MCGIVALFSHQRRISAEVRKRGTKSFYHRGPDGRRALKNNTPDAKHIFLVRSRGCGCGRFVAKELRCNR